MIEQHVNNNHEKKMKLNWEESKSEFSTSYREVHSIRNGPLWQAERFVSSKTEVYVAMDPSF